MKIILIFLTFYSTFHLILSQQFCDVRDIFVDDRKCYLNSTQKQQEQSPYINHNDDDLTFILYSVSPVEGFNLRRDVYLRMAIFMKSLRQVEGYKNSFLVLPAFHHLYHWKSHFQQMNMFWNHFFDLPSLKMYTSVLDMWEFFDAILKITGQPFVNIDEVYRLQHFESMMESGVFTDKYEEIACPRNHHENNHYLEYFNITEKTITCLNFQGSSTLLIDVLRDYQPKRESSKKPRIVLFAHAETALHEYFGDSEYWKARRSMRFNSFLEAIGNAYRRDFLGSTNEKDAVQRPEKWTSEKVCFLCHFQNL
jgi:peptide-O-fucosyltransferase